MIYKTLKQAKIEKKLNILIDLVLSDRENIIDIIRIIQEIKQDYRIEILNTYQEVN